LKVTVNSRATRGSYKITVSGNNGSFTHSTSFTLTIN
jgi:hypothetical protein